METTSNLKQHIDKKLIRKFRVLILLLVIMAGVMVYEIVISHINIFLALSGSVLGLAVGVVAGRMFSIEWHEEQGQVISRLDTIGIIILILYMGFSVARHWIFAHWLVGAVLSAFTFSFVEGAMIGRILSLRFHIKKVLTAQGKI